MSMHIVAIIVLAPLLMVGGVLLWLKATEFGRMPEGDRLARMQKSPQYNREAGRFENIHPRNFNREIKAMPLLKEQFFGPQIRQPSAPLPAVAFDRTAFESGDLKYTWIGHSTFLLRLAGKTLLFDPVFSGDVAPLPILGRRFQEPPLQLTDLPTVDIVLISHDHYDHLDRESILFLKQTNATFMTALGVGARLEGWGVPADRIVELDWWEQKTLAGITFHCTPSQHFSGRSLDDAQKTLWSSWVLESAGRKLYFSGDSGYADHFKTIGERLGPIDVAFLENGQYDNRWRYVHMLPEETVQAAIDLKAKMMLPIHWGMFSISFHDWFDPIKRTYSEARRRGMPLLTPRLGAVVDLSADLAKADVAEDRWWESHPDFRSSDTSHP